MAPSGLGEHREEKPSGGRSIAPFGRPGPFVTAAAVSLILTVLTGLALGIVFETVDDYNIMMSLSGEKTGSPYWQLTFYNSLFALMQAQLYALVPGVQWYSLIELGLIYVGNFVFLGLVLERCDRNGISWALALLAYPLIFCAALLYPVQRMQFTTTSALLGMASCAAIYSIDASTLDKRSLRRRLILSGILLLLCLLERQSAGFCAAVFWISGLVRIGILAGAGIFSNVKANVRTVAIVSIAAVGLCALFTAGHELVNRLGDNADYASYDEWRVQYQDYPRPTYDEAVGVYSAAGWSREVYSIAASLTYISPKINEQAFKEIVQSPEMDAAGPSLVDAVKNDVTLVVSNKAARALFCALLAFYGVICGQTVLSRGLPGSAGQYRRILFFGATGVVLLAIAASVVVCLSGRWPLRSFQAIGLPLMACLAMLALELAPLCKRPVGASEVMAARNGPRVVSPLSSGQLVQVALCFIMLTAGALFGVECIRETCTRDEGSLTQMASIEKYAIEHPGDVFVHDYSVSNIWNSYDPFRVYDDSPCNLIISGGSYTYSGCYHAQLKANGMTRLTGEELLNERVFYVSDTDHPNFLRKTLDYMRSEFGDVEAVEVASLSGGVKVYKFKAN